MNVAHNSGHWKIAYTRMIFMKVVTSVATDVVHLLPKYHACPLHQLTRLPLSLSTASRRGSFSALKAPWSQMEVPPWNLSPRNEAP